MRGSAAAEVDSGWLVEDDDLTPTLVRADMEGVEVRVRLRFANADAEHNPGTVVSTGAAVADIVDVEAAIVMDRGQAQRCADELARQLARQREQIRFAMAADGLTVEAGDVLMLDGVGWRIVEISHGKVAELEAVRAGETMSAVLTPAAPAWHKPPPPPIEPDVVIVDGPPLLGQENDMRPIGFAFAEPWIGEVTVSAGADATLMTERGRIEQPCTMGELVSGLYPNTSGRWQETSVWVSVRGGAPSSRSEGAVLNGANAALVETGAGWEFLQFLEAELVDEETYRLSGLLRGQQGSEDAASAGAPVGSRIVFLTGAERTARSC